MPNFVPYLILATLSLAALGALLLHFRAARPLILFLSYAGMIYVFEFFVLICFDSYSYFPHLIDIAYYDNVTGAVVSNLLAVPIAAVYVAIFRWKWRWIAVLSLGYGGIDWLFIQLGIYEHHWWNTAYTILGVFFFFLLARQWLMWLSGSSRAMKFITLTMFAWSVTGTLVYALALTGIRMFHIGVFEDPYHDDVFTGGIYVFLKTVVLVVGATVTHRRWSRAASLLVVFAAQLLLLQIGILKLMIPLWQYGLLYAPCCIFVSWLISATRRKLERFGAEG